jgi:phenylalanyl-tRNA synthetase beta chain
VLEAATFDAATIRSGAGKLGLRTDASVRFEKSLDPELCPRALQKAIELIKQICPTAELVGTPTDHYPDPSPKLVIEAPRTIFNTLLGTTIPEAIAEHILTRLGFGVTIKKNILSVVVPSWRATKDISLPEDIVEEVARIYGYDNIPALLPILPLAPVIISPLRTLEQIVKTTLAERVDASETPSYSFVSEKQITALGDDTARYLELTNPLSAEKPFLRRSLVPNLLETARLNSTHLPRVRIFEIGKVFQAEHTGENMNPRHDGRLPRQDTHLTLVITEEKNTQPFFEAKRALEIISHTTTLPFTVSPAPIAMPHHHPGRSAEVLCGTTSVGALYELHPTAAELYGFINRVAILELNHSTASGCAQQARHIEKISLFPHVERDIAFLVDIHTAYELLVATIKKTDDLITSVGLVDHYQGEQLPSGTKSLTLRLTLGANDRTLTTLDIDTVLHKVVQQLTDVHNITLR